MKIDLELFWQRLVASGIDCFREGIDLEFKLAAGADGRGALPGSLWESYSAMANTRGGVIILGVREHKDGSVSVNGVPDRERVVKDFWNSVNNPNKVSVNLLKDEDVKCVSVATDEGAKNLIVICVPRAKRVEIPVYLNGNPFGGTYRRMNEGDFKCPQNIVERLLADKQYDTLDGRIFDKYGMQDVDVGSLAGCDFIGVKHPELREDLELYQSRLIFPQDAGVKGGVRGGVNQAETLLDVIRANPGKRIPFYAELTGRTIKSVEHDIDDLKRTAVPLVEFRGAPKTGGYYVIEGRGT